MVIVWHEVITIIPSVDAALGIPSGQDSSAGLRDFFP